MSMHSDPAAARATCLRMFSPSKLLPCAQARSSSVALPRPSRKLWLDLPRRLPRRLWLDELPLEVCTRIAAYVSRSERREPAYYQSRSALHLAEVSEGMRLAVLAALKYKLSFPTGHDLRWADVFRDRIQEVSIEPSRPIVYRHADGNEFYNLLKAPTLRFAAISNFGPDLKAVGDAPQLRELCVMFSQRSSMRGFWAALRKLDLRVLRLICPVTMSPICVCRDLLSPKAACAKLAARCRNLDALEIACNCDDSKADLAPLLSALPNLRTLTVNKTVADSAIPYLQKLESVILLYGARPPFSHALNNMDVQLEQAVKVGAAVTGIESVEGRCSESISVIDAESVAMLGKCPRLKRLDMCIEEGAEWRFPELPELQSLRLCWDNRFLDLEPAEQEKVQMYEAPVPAFFSRIIETAPHLKELCLFHARISLDDLVGMLSRIGEQLEVFGTSIMGQGIRPQEHCIGVIEATTKYNPMLLRLVLKVNRIDGSDERMRGVGLHWRRRILKAMSLLQRSAPLVDIDMDDGLQEWLYERAYDYTRNNM